MTAARYLIRARRRPGRRLFLFRHPYTAEVLHDDLEIGRTRSRKLHDAIRAAHRLVARHAGLDLTYPPVRVVVLGEGAEVVDLRPDGRGVGPIA